MGRKSFASPSLERSNIHGRRKEIIFPVRLIVTVRRDKSQLSSRQVCQGSRLQCCITFYESSHFSCSTWTAAHVAWLWTSPVRVIMYVVHGCCIAFVWREVRVKYASIAPLPLNAETSTLSLTLWIDLNTGPRINHRPPSIFHQYGIVDVEWRLGGHVKSDCFLRPRLRVIEDGSYVLRFLPPFPPR